MVGFYGEFVCILGSVVGLPVDFGELQTRCILGAVVGLCSGFCRFWWTVFRLYVGFLCKGFSVDFGVFLYGFFGIGCFTFGFSTFQCSLVIFWLFVSGLIRIGWL